MSQTARMARLLEGSTRELLPNWLDSAIVTERVVDFSNDAEWPEMALAREHLRKQRETGRE